MTELKKALQAKILEFEGYKNYPAYQSEIEQNAVKVTLRELRYLDSIVEFEQLNKPVVSGSSSFVCQGCKCEVPNNFSVKTDGYCYLCDPKVTLEECLQDEYPKSWR